MFPMWLSRLDPHCGVRLLQVHMGRQHRYTQTQGAFLPNFGLVPIDCCKAQSALNCIRARSRVPAKEEMNRITIDDRLGGRATVATRFTLLLHCLFSPSLLVGATTNAVGKGARGTCHNFPQLPLGSLWNFTIVYSHYSGSVCECAGRGSWWTHAISMAVRPHQTLAHLTPGSWFSWPDIEGRQLMLVEFVSWIPANQHGPPMLRLQHRTPPTQWIETRSSLICLWRGCFVARCFKQALLDRWRTSAQPSRIAAGQSIFSFNMRPGKSGSNW